jgi:glycosyltransferase involved in cell wall biosynthesis
VQTAKVQAAGALQTIGRMVWSFEAARAMDRLLREWRPQVAHVHNLYTQMSPSILPVLKRHGVRVVQTVHDWHLLSANYPLFDRHGLDTDGGWWSVVRRRSVKDSLAASLVAASVHALHHRVLRVYERSVDELIFTSAFARSLFQARGWSGAHGTIIPYVIDLAGADRVERHDGGRFLFVGRIHATKGVEVLLRAARLTGLPVDIIGDGPDRSALMRAFADVATVQWLGALPRAQVLARMRDARAVVVPSVWYEPFGLVAIEPGGLGTPVIASRTGGLAEIVAHQQTGLQVAPGHVEELADAMQYLHANPQVAAHMGALAKRRFASAYSAEEHMKRLMEVYLDKGLPV